MKLTGVFVPEPGGGFSCYVEEIPGAISQGETIEEAKTNLLEALQLVVECQRELAERELVPGSIKQTLDPAFA